MNINIHRDGQDFGPYTLEQVNQYLRDGSIVPSDMAWHDGLPDWVPLPQVKGVLVPAGTAINANLSGGGKKMVLGISLAAVAAALVTGGIVYVVMNKGGGEGGGGDEGGGGGSSMTFMAQIKPVFQEKCWRCHGDDNKKGDYSLNSAETAMKAIKAGDPDGSDLFKRVKRADEDDAMPPKAGEKLTDAEVELVRKWIASGAKWE